jgi:predicted TIM-barrel fold metal-dependent hydrolase
MEEYWEANFWVTTTGVQDTGTSRETLRSVGEERAIFSVNYPLEDDLEIAAWFDGLEFNEQTRRKIGYENETTLLKLGG